MESLPASQSATLVHSNPIEFLESLLPIIRQVVNEQYRLREISCFSDQDDLFQELVLLLIDKDYRVLRRYDNQRASAKTWLRAILRHRMLDLYRRKMRQDIILLSLRFYATPWAISPEDTLLHNEVIETYDHAKSYLSHADLILLGLLDENEYQYSSVAESLHISQVALYQRKRRLSTKMRKILSANRNVV